MQENLENRSYFIPEYLSFFRFLSGMWNQLFREGRVIKQMRRHLALKSVMILILIIQTLKCCPQPLMETVQTRKNKPPLLIRENRLFEYKKYTLIQTFTIFFIQHSEFILLELE